MGGIVKKSLVWFALCACLAAPAVVAQEGFFVSGTVGYARLKLSPAQFGQTTLVSNNDNDLSSGANLGYLFADDNADFLLGFEMGYQGLGEASFKASGYPTLKADLYGINAGLIVVAPMSGFIDVYGKVGQYKWELDWGVLDNVRQARKGKDVYFGFGGKYRFADNLGLGLELIRYAVENKDDTFNTSAGINVFNAVLFAHF